MIASLYLVSTNRHELIIGVILFIPAMTTKWMLAPFVSIDGQILAYCIFQVLFLGYVMSTVFRYLMSTKKVDSELIYAAIVLYLMFGLCMALVYYGILILEPSTFGGDIVVDFSDSSSMTAVLHDLLYFSFVTQTTLGYGDVLPMSVWAQAASMVEVVIGYVMLGGALSIFTTKMARRAS